MHLLSAVRVQKLPVPGADWPWPLRRGCSFDCAPGLPHLPGHAHRLGTGPSPRALLLRTPLREGIEGGLL